MARGVADTRSLSSEDSHATIRRLATLNSGARRNDIRRATRAGSATRGDGSAFCASRRTS